VPSRVSGKWCVGQDRLFRTIFISRLNRNF
jgi:hypothetical protein